MKLGAALLWAALISTGSAAPMCISGSLASYGLLGSAGCTIGVDTVASFAVVSGMAGATPIDPTTVSITPGGGTTNPSLTFETNLTANFPTQLEAIFTYTLSGPGVEFTMDVLTLSNSSETVDGLVTDVQNYCFGGSFGPDGVSGCTGSTTGTLLGWDGVQNTDQTTIPGSAFLNITDDFVLDGGMAGSATGGTFEDQFTGTTAAPEPGVFLLTACGLAVVGLRKLRQIL